MSHLSHKIQHQDRRFTTSPTLFHSRLCYALDNPDLVFWLFYNGKLKSAFTLEKKYRYEDDDEMERNVLTIGRMDWSRDWAYYDAEEGNYHKNCLCDGCINAEKAAKAMRIGQRQTK